MNRTQSSVVAIFTLLFAASVAQAEFLVGIGLSNYQMQPKFNEFTTFEPVDQVQRFRQLTQERDRLAGALDLSFSMRQEYLNGRFSLTSSAKFQLGFSGVSGRFSNYIEAPLDWKLDPLSQYGVESRISFKPTAWINKPNKRALYCSIGINKASADFSIRADGVPFSDTAEGRVSTFGCGIELTRESHIWDFGLKRSHGFLNTYVETRDISAIRSLVYEFEVDSWGVGITYGRRVGGK